MDCRTALSQFGGGSWLSELLVGVPDSYWFCYNNAYTWTCTTIDVITDNNNNKLITTSASQNKPTADGETDQISIAVHLNGRPVINLNEHFDGKIQPLESKNVFIDVKVL